MRHEVHTRTVVAGIVVLMLACGGVVASPEAAVLQTMRALDASGLLLDTQRLEQAAVDGILQAVDPEAQRVPRGERLAIEDHPLRMQLEAWSNGILYACMGSASVTGELASAESVRTAVASNTIGVVLDFRGAGGHDLAALDDMGGLFFEDGVELYQLRNGSSNVVARHSARAPGPAPHLPPVMLLVDNQTHGTSEALAALLQHHANVMLLGLPTQGSAAWRERVPLSDMEDAFIATAWLTPTTGTVYHGFGVYPDVLVTPPTNSPPEMTQLEPVAPDTQTVSNVAAPAVDLEAHAGDVLLRRAADILLGLHALRKP